MSEEEINFYIRDMIEKIKEAKNQKTIFGKEYEKDLQAIQGLLDLYNKEKEKNKKLNAKRIRDVSSVKNYISKDKIRQEIKELEQNQEQLQLARADLIYSAKDIIRHQILLLEDILEE